MCILICTLLSCSREKEDDYMNVKKVPLSENFKGEYIFEREFHEKILGLPKDSIILFLNADNSFTVKNYPYSKSFFGSDTLKFIPTACGTWRFKLHLNDNKDFPISLFLDFTNDYKQYNSIPNTDKINNFTYSQEMYKNKKDSTYHIGFYNGDSDSNSNRFYFRQKK